MSKFCNYFLSLAHKIHQGFVFIRGVQREITRAPSAYFKLIHTHYSYMMKIFQGYVWLKDKILSEDGRRQQAKLREAAVIADRIGCSITQLAIGKEKNLFVITFPFIKGWYHKISKNRCNYFFIEFLRNKLQLNLSDISFKSSLGNQNITCPFH